MSREKSEEFLNDPIVTIEDAHRCLSYYGYNNQYLYRQHKERYDEIEGLNISYFTKRTWELEELSETYNHIMHKSVDELNSKDYLFLNKHTSFDDVFLKKEFKYIVIKLYLSSNKHNVDNALVGDNIPLDNGLITYVMDYNLKDLAQLYCDMAYYRILNNHKPTESKNELAMNRLITVANRFNLEIGSMTEIELDEYISKTLADKMDTFVDVDFSKHIMTHNPNTKVSEENIKLLETGYYAEKSQQIFKMEISELLEADFIELMSLYHTYFDISGQKLLLFLVFRFYLSNIKNKKTVLSSIVEDPINFEKGLINIAMTFDLKKHAQYYMNIAYYLIKEVYDKESTEYTENMTNLKTFKKKYNLKMKTLSRKKLDKVAKESNALMENTIINKN